MKRKTSARKSQYLKFTVGIAVVVVLGLGGKLLWDAVPHSNAVQVAATPAARNDLRRANLKLMAGAFNRYIAEVGNLPITIPAHQTGICSGTGAVCKKAGMVDLLFLSSKGYLTASPNDPVGGHDLYSTGYSVGRDGPKGEIVLTAPRAEDGAVIKQTVQ